ncbi:MAG: IclR family transcriptional regulator [Treponema sp.]|jgi:DNA-binding IclR family transcriptional regulator|nr:IclR family transcriptional regulator [Treponema sp.]
MDNKNMIQKTVDILFYLAANSKGAKLTEIADKLQIPKTTVFDILKTLVKNDFVHYLNVQKKVYGIGSQIYAIGMTYLDSSNLLTIAKPYLTLLADKYEKTTFIAKRHHDKVICIYKYASPSTKAPTSNINDRKMLHSTAIGKCYLAFDTGAYSLIDTIELIPRTPYTITSRERLKEQVQQIQALGYSYERQESHEKMACVAAPIYDHGAMVATISMTGFYREDEDFSAQGNELVQLAGIISGQMDHTKVGQ